MTTTSKDYQRVELVWPGKRTEVERIRLPFQVIERVNDVRRSRDGQAPMLRGATELPDWWPERLARNKLIWGDNKYVLASLLDGFSGKIDLIYIDPPFDTGDVSGSRFSLVSRQVDRILYARSRHSSNKSRTVTCGGGCGGGCSTSTIAWCSRRNFCRHLERSMST